MDLMKLTYNEAKKVIKKLLEKNETILILGEPGIGKSSLVEEVGRELGLSVHYFNLNYITKNDIVMMSINEEGVVDYKLPKYLYEIINNERSVLFLDEFNTAEPSLQSILLEITWKRLLFNKRIRCRIALAGNNSYNSLANEIIVPLQTRIFKIELIVNFEEWVRYIVKKYELDERQKMYLTFLEYNSELFVNNEKALNPRVHESVIRYMGEFEELDEKTVIGGWAGEWLAEKYLMFKKEILPIASKKSEEIIKEWKNLKNGQRIYIINRMIENLSEKELIEFIENVEEEWGVMILRKFVAHKKDENEKILTLNRLLKKLPKLNKFLSELINS